MKTPRLNLGALVTAVLLCTTLSAPVYAKDDIEALKEQVSALQKRISELESQQPQNTRVRPYATSPWNGGMPDMYSMIQDMQDQMSQLFEDSMVMQGTAPMGFFTSDLLFNEDYKMTEKPDSYEIRFDLAGLDENGINIEVKNQTLTLSGISSNETEKQGQNGYIKSHSYGSFLKSVALPSDADTTQMSTKKENGTLIIDLPKRQT